MWPQSLVGLRLFSFVARGFQPSLQKRNCNSPSRCPIFVGMNSQEIKDLLDLKYDQFNVEDFKDEDPVCIPHQFQKKEDIEIAGFLTALIAWGRRASIINNANKLIDLLDRAPFQWVMGFEESDLAGLDHFVHRTFNGLDLVALIRSLRIVYEQEGGLEGIFVLRKDMEDTQEAIVNARKKLLEQAHMPGRTHKHVANPAKGSSAKRINMYLRWMVRDDKRGVDFGLWKHIRMDQLVCPLDVHTGTVARKLGLLTRKQNDWKAAIELTQKLREFNPQDPVRYDYSLFGLGAYDKF